VGHWGHSKIIDCGRWLRYVLHDGPLPAETMRAAARQAGFVPKTLVEARKRYGIETLRIGFGGTGQQAWWRIQGDRRQPQLSTRAVDAWVICDHGHTYVINSSVLPKPCVISTCDGIARIPTDLAQPATQTPKSLRVSNASIDLEAWRTGPSPLRTQPIRRSSARRTQAIPGRTQRIRRRR
jgi:hypothetical protein